MNRQNRQRPTAQLAECSDRESGTWLAEAGSVRTALLLLLAPAVAFAEPKAEPNKHVQIGDAVESEPMWEAELQLGYGISKRGSEEMTKTATGPLSFAALGAVAVSEDPHVYAVGGLVGETLERSAIGVTAGARLRIPGTPVRLTGTGVWMVAPKTLWGASASAGACWGGGKLGVCADLQITAYVAGTALPKDELELQAAFVLGFVARGGN
jgi:hypothetical protein